MLTENSHNTTNTQWPSPHMFIADAITGIRRKRIESGGGTVALFIELSCFSSAARVIRTILKPHGILYCNCSPTLWFLCRLAPLGVFESHHSVVKVPPQIRLGLRMYALEVRFDGAFNHRVYARDSRVRIRFFVVDSIR